MTAMHYRIFAFLLMVFLFLTLDRLLGWQMGALLGIQLPERWLWGLLQP